MAKVKVLTLVGARPNFVKLASLHLAFSHRDDIVHRIVHTGQHYDFKMSDSFFQEFSLPEPDYNLGVGSGSAAEQIGNTMMLVEPVLLKESPDWTVVVGDVNATISGAIVAKRHGLALAHVEAGLRSHDWGMPEEINRVVTDRLADLLLLSEAGAMENLKMEGVEAARCYFVGNVMIDTLIHCLPLAEERDISSKWGVSDKDYVVVTIHRPSNTDNADLLLSWMSAIEDIARDTKVVFPVHPRTSQCLERIGYDVENSSISIIEPLGYVDMLALLKSAKCVFTDSGGIQEETSALSIPCITLRENTERPITVEQGTNVLLGSSPSALAQVFSAKVSAAPAKTTIEKWDGKTGDRIADILVSECGKMLRSR